MIRKHLTTLSLIALLLSVGLWGMNFKWVVVCVCNRRIAFAFSEGRLCIGGFFGELTDSHRGYSRNGIMVLDTSKERFQWMPRYTSYGTKNAVRAVYIPLWMPTLLFGSLFMILFLPRHRRRKRKKLGLCLTCGYDLRGSKEHCSECGEAFESPELKAGH